MYEIKEACESDEEHYFLPWTGLVTHVVMDQVKEDTFFGPKAAAFLYTIGNLNKLEMYSLEFTCFVGVSTCVDELETDGARGTGGSILDCPTTL